MLLQRGSSFVLGVNYWPRRKAMKMWKHFNEDEIRADFATIHSLGMTLVRVFLLMEDFLPSHDAVSPSCLQKLERLADIAKDEHVLLDVTFFTGHMSGPNWIPHWMLLRDEPMPSHVVQVVSEGNVVNCGYRHFFTDPLVVAAERLLLEHVVRRLVHHPAVALWNLGNEPDLVNIPTPEEAHNWIESMTKLIRLHDPTHRPITCGMHTPSLRENVGFRVNSFASTLDVAVIHGYPMYAKGWSRDPLDEMFVPFLCALTSALCNNEKPTLAEEFGGCMQPPGVASDTLEFSSYGSTRRQFMASEDDFARYLEGVLRNLLLVGASGAMLWCYADYEESLWNEPPCKESYHERFFGMVRPDGSLKPHAEVIRKFAQSEPKIALKPQLVIPSQDPEQYYKNPEKMSSQLYEEFLRQ